MANPLVSVFMVVIMSMLVIGTARKVAPGGSKDSTSYAVVFDAGSSGSRVHVFCFDANMSLVPVENEIEVFVQTKPGLSTYAKDPRAAANSLVPLLDKAESSVPKESRSKTPVRVGATAGLRLLEGDASDKILQAVRDLLRNSSLKYDANGVSILDGSQEGSYQWVTINYLLGSLGKKYPETVGVVDLGGGSVQMAYAVSDAVAAKAPPRVPNGNDTYVKGMNLMGSKYNLYVHSYLNYGLLAARAEILKVSGHSANPCILAGYDGVYTYGGKGYKAKALPSGSTLEGCRSVVLEALKVKASCAHKNCTFGGIWNGGGGAGQKNLYVASFFFDRAAEAGFINSSAPVAKVRPVDFHMAARKACKTNLKNGKSRYPTVEESNLPYLCLDLVYQYTLLVDGFGVKPRREITLVKQVEYSKFQVEAAWPLGSAIVALSS